MVNYVTDIIILRWKLKKNFGTLLLPEGLLHYLPEFKQLIDELNAIFKGKSSEVQN